ncbi:MAG TPA: dTDP-4-dehydrorhamnose 3,5-epimerase family protein [Bryobacteraceae bacterium]|nr:dTDP-4-dehydrorhamnose 3,5-epimerase family protein [Bryobacteraceae bacterium]
MSDPVEYQLPANAEKSIGNVILRPTAEQLIPGVEVFPYNLWPDDRGYFLEVARIGKAGVASFPPESTQISAALSLPGTIKAFHIHRFQTDYWSPSSGMFQVALVDLRPDSPAFGRRNTFYVGALRPWQILIPPGVGHGYKVISPEPAMLVYVTNQTYNPADEGRIAYNDPGINYDWELQYK